MLWHSAHSPRNFFKNFHDPKMVKIGHPSYGLFLGSFENQGDWRYGEISAPFKL